MGPHLAITGLVLGLLLLPLSDARREGTLEARAEGLRISGLYGAAPITDTFIDDEEVDFDDESLPEYPAPDPRVLRLQPPPGPVMILAVASVPVVHELTRALQLPVAPPVVSPVRLISTSRLPALSADQILSNAKGLLGVPYVWGGNSGTGMDCSAYVSRVWGLGRHTTDSLPSVSFKIAKEELVPGDILNLTTGQDPRGYGHVRLFAGWANEQQTKMWVYEETAPRSVYHAITYDPRYTPMRRYDFATHGVPGAVSPDTVVAADLEALAIVTSQRAAATGTPGTRPASTGASTGGGFVATPKYAPKPVTDVFVSAGGSNQPAAAPASFVRANKPANSNSDSGSGGQTDHNNDTPKTTTPKVSRTPVPVKTATAAPSRHNDTSAKPPATVPARSQRPKDDDDDDRPVATPTQRPARTATPAPVKTPSPAPKAADPTPVRTPAPVQTAAPAAPRAAAPPVTPAPTQPKPVPTATPRPAVTPPPAPKPAVTPPPAPANNGNGNGNANGNANKGGNGNDKGGNGNGNGRGRGKD